MGLALLALNLFVLSPLLMSVAGPLWANGIYSIFRLAVFFGIGFCLTAWAQAPRFRVLMSAVFVAWFEQLGLRGGLLWSDSLRNPEAWEGASRSGLLYGLTMGLVTFLPIILMLAWAGTEAAKSWSSRKLRRSYPPHQAQDFS
jgi:hypothetical protein